MTQVHINPTDIATDPADIIQAAQTVEAVQTVEINDTEDILDTITTQNMGDTAKPVSTPSYIYALGRIQAQFPSNSVQNLYKEVSFHKFGPDAENKSLFEVLSMPEHLFLAKKMCWVLTIDELDCYVLDAKTPSLLSAFIKALQPKSSQQFEYIIAQMGPYAADNQCAGRTIPLAYVHQIQSFTVDDYCQVLCQQTDVELSKIKPLFNSMLKFCRNTGDLPAQRALNYLSLKCTSLYKTFANPALAQHKEGIEFENIDAMTGSTDSNRHVMTLVFSYLNQESKRVEKQHINIDVTELYPFSCSELIYGEPS